MPFRVKTFSGGTWRNNAGRILRLGVKLENSTRIIAYLFLTRRSYIARVLNEKRAVHLLRAMCIGPREAEKNEAELLRNFLSH